ncbi:MAG: T9SS type B sorting domain-containing protein [Flavobacteriaceae bacterium]|nr:T9SS type B sorting domain-containing protein [Flavobacteriaceae bacterium]
MRKLVLLFSILFSVSLTAQVFVIEDGVTINSCSGTFVDTGGATGPYSGNESITYVICPETAGQLVQLDFTAFATQAGADVMAIYNADDALDATTLFGNFSGTTAASSPGFVSATQDNVSGCITIVFTSSGGVNDTGWVADISCFEPCQTIVSVLDSSSPESNDDGYIQVCPNEEITLTGSGQFSTSGDGATYEWDLGDGTTQAGQTAVFSYDTPGVYLVNLDITDTNTSVDEGGCKNTNLINQVIQVALPTDFTGTAATDSTICFGDSTTINGVANVVPFLNECTPPESEVTFLPDGSGAVYETEIIVDCFESDQTLDDINQLIEICLVMEHSYLGDLDIEIISPTGELVRLHDQGGGSANLGIPWATAAVDGQSNILTPGVGFQYCFIPGNAFPTLVGGIQPDEMFVSGDGPATYSDSFVPEGTYSSVNSLNGLIGSSLNGSWTIRITDNIGQDNGYIFSWVLNFDPTIQPPDLSFTPTMVSESWDDDSSIINTEGNTITVQPSAEGVFCYTYRALDDFGCEYSEEVCIEVSPELVYAAPDDLFVCNTGTAFGVFDLTENDAIIYAPTTNQGDFVLTYHETQANADADSNPISAADVVAFSGTDGQIIYARFEYKTSGCYETVSFTLNLLDQPLIFLPTDMVVCDDISNDGSESFDLSSQTLDILGAQLPENYSVSYYISFEDADAGTNNLSSPYDNISSPEPIYVRVEANAGAGCYIADVNPVFNLVVNHKANASGLTNLQTCDDDLDGFMTFDLEQQTTLVLGDQIDSDFTVTYHETEVDADSGSNPLTSPFTNTIANQQTIFTRVEEIGLEACYETTQFDVIVNPLPSTVTMTALSICDDDADGLGLFTLTTKDTEALNGQTGIAVSYHETQGDADTNTSPLASPYTNTIGNSQIIIIRLENTTTNCFSTMPLELRVNPLPIANAIGTQTICDDDYDGLATFDFTGIDLIVAGTQLEMVVSYHETQGDADTNSSPVTSPYTSIIPDEQTLFIRLENTTTGCFDTTTLELLVDPLPVVPTITDYELCDDTNAGDLQELFDLSTKDTEIINGQNVSVTYYETETDALNNINELTGLYQNTSSPQTLHVALTDLTTGCRITGSFTLIVNPLPQLVVPTELEICDDGTPDGFTQIDLTDKDGEIQNGNTNYSITYYLTQLDADSETNPLVSPYTNISNPQTVIARGQDINTGCFTTVALDLKVSPSPEAIIPQDLTNCDPDSDGFGVFMLTDKDLEISNGVAGITISYHETMSDAENEVNALSSPYNNIQVDTQTVFARIVNPTITTLCATIVELVLVVNPTPQLFDPTSLEVCDDDADEFAQFNLTTKADEFLDLVPASEVTIGYYETQVDAQNETFEIVTPADYTNLSNPQTVWIRVAYNATGCEKITSLELIVNPLPVLVDPSPLLLCDDNAPGDEQEAFTLEDREGQILNGQTGLDFSYHLTQLDAEANSSPLSSPYTNISNPQTVFVRVSNQVTGCYDFTSLTLEVLPIPVPQTPANIDLCDDNASGNGQEVFDLTQNETFLLDGELGVTPTYHETLTDAEAGTNSIQFPDTYTNTNIPIQTIYVRVTNDITGCFAIVDFDVIVNPLPEANPVATLIACELNTDGIYAFDLEVQTDLIRGAQSASEFLVTYYETSLDATQGINPLTSPYMNTSNPQTLYVNVLNTITRCQNTTIEFNLEVLEAAQATSPDEPFALCDDNVETDNDPTNDSVLFDLTTQDSFVLNGQDPTNYLVRYFASQIDADLDQFELPSFYQNTVNPQVIFARVDNNTQIIDATGTLVDSSVCYETAPLILKVNPLPYIDIDDEYVLCVDTNGTEVLGPLEITTGLSNSDYIFIWRDDAGAVVETTSSYIPTEAGVYTLEVFDALLATQCAAPIEVFTVIESSPPTVTAVVTTQAFADTHIVEVTATGLGDYEYNIDQGPWQDTGIFVGVNPGERVVNVRDLNGCGVGQAVVFIIDYPKYFTPNGDGYHDSWNILSVSNQLSAKIQIFDRYGKLLKEIRPSSDGWDGTYNGAMLPSSDYWFVLYYNEPVTGEPTLLNAHFTLKR